MNPMGELTQLETHPLRPTEKKNQNQQKTPKAKRWRWRRRGVFFRTWFSRHGGVGLAVGLDDLRGLFQPE